MLSLPASSAAALSIGNELPVVRSPLSIHAREMRHIGLCHDSWSALGRTGLVVWLLCEQLFEREVCWMGFAIFEASPGDASLQLSGHAWFGERSAREHHVTSTSRFNRRNACLGNVTGR